MKIKRVIVGNLETNCYIVYLEKGCVIIDPGDEALKIIETINQSNVLTVLTTHSHFDHVGALAEILKYYNIKVNNYDLVDNLEVINTPGHTDDSVTYYFKDDDIMFCGDFIFKKTHGRTDLGGNNKKMIESLQKISQYPDKIRLYPGHGLSTTLEEEKKYFLNYIDELKKCWHFNDVMLG